MAVVKVTEESTGAVCLWLRHDDSSEFMMVSFSPKQAKTVGEKLFQAGCNVEAEQTKNTT